ncbi:hypothetical protein A4S06_09270 [Erysipelotrichaceae bacterium MTC7]|nr:hypothetical protein A4S06_09270 [Erysipelotrichaceae bacterium MTC7]
MGIAFIILFFVLGYHCPINSILGIPCPGCGMTRAFLQLLQLDVASALYYHPLCIVFGFYVIFMAYVYIKEHTFYGNKARYATWFMIALFLVVYIIRMIYIFPNAPMSLEKDAVIFRLIEVIKN